MQVKTVSSYRRISIINSGVIKGS